MTALPRPPSIFDDGFGKKPADIGVHLWSGGGNKVGTVIGLQIGTHLQLGRDDPVVMTVLSMYKQFKKDTAARRMGQTRVNVYNARIGQISYRLTVVDVPPEPGMYQQGSNLVLKGRVTAKMDGRKDVWEIKPVVVEEWKEVMDFSM